MKKSPLFRFIATGFAAATMFLTSCTEDIIKLHIPMEYAEATFVIPANSQSGSTVVSEEKMRTKIDSVLAANGASREDISEIRLTSMKFVMENGDENTNFSFLQNARAEMNSDVRPTFINLGEIIENPDAEPYELDFPVNKTVNFREYLDGNEFTVKATGTTRKPVAKDVTVRAKLEFDIVAGR